MLGNTTFSPSLSHLYSKYEDYNQFFLLKNDHKETAYRNYDVWSFTLISSGRLGWGKHHVWVRWIGN